MFAMQKYSAEEINILREGGRRLAHILEVLEQNCVEGMVASELDKLAEKMVLEGGDIPVFKNYKPRGASYPFPATVCVSINEVVAHGIPKNQILQKGDVVSLDLGLRHGGLVVDSAVSVVVGGRAGPCF
jgi:methionyl aminopeptidase